MAAARNIVIVNTVTTSQPSETRIKSRGSVPVG
jgi:hypothetical protein